MSHKRTILTLYHYPTNLQCAPLKIIKIIKTLSLWIGKKYTLGMLAPLSCEGRKHTPVTGFNLT